MPLVGGQCVVHHETLSEVNDHLIQPSQVTKLSLCGHTKYFLLLSKCVATESLGITFLMINTEGPSTVAF